jgi:hypothetical protein
MRIVAPHSLLLLFLFFVCHANAADPITTTFRGTVIDSQTELPIPGANVVILESDPFTGTSAAADGTFSLPNLPVGRIDVQVSAMGYTPAILNNLMLSSGKELVLYIRLEEQVYRLQEVSVRPEVRKDQPLNEMASVSARSFSVDETERYAGSLGDPSRMAANFAGVSSASDQRNDIIIRGNTPLGLLWRIDGVEVPNPNHFGSVGSTGGPISMLNNNLLTNSDFYTGAFPAEFGNALAGAFDIKMRYGNNQRHEHMAQVGFNGFEIGSEGPFSSGGNASYLFNFRYSTLEVLKELGMSFGTGEAVPQYKDLSFKLNFPTKRGRISLFGIGGTSYIEMLDSRGDSTSFGFTGTDVRFGADMGVAGLTHVHYFPGDARLTTSVSVAGIENRSNIIDLALDPEQEMIVERDYDIKYSLSSRFSHKLDARNYFHAGLVFDMHRVKYRGKQYEPAWDTYFYYMNSLGNFGVTRLFGEWQHRFSNEFVVNAGLHSTVLLLNGSFAAEPRLGMRWEARPGQTFSLGFGLHSQSQMKAVYFMEELTDTMNLVYRKSNENLDFSRSLHLVAGYDRLLGEDHRLKLEAYFQHLYHIPVAAIRPQFSLLNTGGGFIFQAFHDMVNEGTGRNVGLEMTLEKFLSKGFYYLVTASVFDAQYQGYDGQWRNSAFNNNYIFNALAGYELKLGERSLLQFDLKGVLAGGRRYLPIDVEASAALDDLVYDWDRAYENRYPDYFRLNARITFRLNGRNLNQEWGLDLQNITNHQNIYMENWNRITGEVSTSYQMGFMPMMTYKIFF